MSFENLPGKRAICPRCLRFHGVYEEDEVTERETLFDEEWLFAISSERLVDRIINTADDDQYYLTSPGTTETRLETIVAAMCYMAFHDTAAAVHFDPERHQALVLVEDGSVAGVLLWGSQCGLELVRQLYVRPSYRRQGVAERLCERWKTEFFDGRVYYLDEPNAKSRSLHRKLGDLQGVSLPHAIETYSLHPHNRVTNNILWSRLQQYYGLSRREID